MADLNSVTHDGVEVSSFTDTPDQLRAALGVEQQPTAPPAEVPPPDTDPDETPAGGEPPAESAAGHALAAKRQKLQKRIDALTWEKEETARARDEARTQARRLEQELADLKRGNGHPPTPPPAASAPEKFPKYADYLQTHPDAELEDWLEARDTWRDTRHAEQTRTREETERRHRSLTERTQTFSAKMQTALQNHPDFLSKVDPRLLQTKPLSGLTPDDHPTFGNFLVEQILKSDQPMALLLHLSNEQEVQRLASLEPDLVIRELAHIESRAGTAPGGSVPAPSTTSTAHPPVKPLGGSPPQDADAPPGDDADDEAHRLYWNQKELARRRRG